MSGYYQLPELEHMQQGSAEELEMRLLGRLQQEALRRLRPVRLKLELQPVPVAPSSGNSRAHSFSGSHADYAAGHQNTASPPKRTITGLHIRRKLALASKHPFGKLSSFGRRLDKRIETCQGTVLYEDALLVVGTELLDLYLASDGSEYDADDADAAATSSGFGSSGDGSAGDHSTGGTSSGAASSLSPAMSMARAASRTMAGASGIGSAMGSAAGVEAGSADQEFAGPAQLRAAQGMELKQRVVASPDLQTAFGGSTLSALQNTYSLSISYAQILAVRQAGPDITVSYLPNIASKEEADLHFTITMDSTEEAERITQTVKEHTLRYLKAIILLQNNYRVDSGSQISLVAHVVDGRETVKLRGPEWGVSLPLPRSWAPDSQVKAAADEELRVYLSSPLGPVKARMTPALLTAYVQGTGKFWVRGTLLHKFTSRVISNSKGLDADEELQRDHEVRLLCSVESSAVSLAEKKAALEAVPALLPQQPQIQPAAQSAASRLLTVNPLLAVSLVLALAAVLFQVPHRQQGGWTKSDAAFMASLATLAASVALTFLRIRRTAAASGSGVPTQSDTSQRVSVNGAAQGAKRQLWTLTLMGADAVHNESLPEHGPIMDVQAMARAASSTADEEGHTEEAAVMKSSTAVPGAPFGDFTPDEEKRFLASADGDKVEAMRRYKAALDWREKVGVGSILEQPQPFFDFAKNMYTHGLVCFTKNGAPVWLDKVGDMKRDWAGFKASRFTVDDATRHMAFEMEILFRKMAPQPFPRGRRLEIVDLKGMTFRDVGSEWFGFAKTLGLTMQAMYPERMYRCFIINAPSFFTMLWRVMDPLMTERVKKKISIFRTGAEAYKALREELEEEDILVEWGGACTRPVYESRWEREAAAIAHSLNTGGSPQRPVTPSPVEASVRGGRFVGHSAAASPVAAGPAAAAHPPAADAVSTSVQPQGHHHRSPSKVISGFAKRHRT